VSRWPKTDTPAALVDRRRFSKYSVESERRFSGHAPE
jgi:hypothetical protein